MTLSTTIALFAIATSYFLTLSFIIVALHRLLHTLHLLLNFRDPLNPSHDKI